MIQKITSFSPKTIIMKNKIEKRLNMDSIEQFQNFYHSLGLEPKNAKKKSYSTTTE